MARQKLGASAKNVVASTRITEQQSQRLIRKYGSLGRALKIMIMKEERESSETTE